MPIAAATEICGACQGTAALAPNSTFNILQLPMTSGPAAVVLKNPSYASTAAVSIPATANARGPADQAQAKPAAVKNQPKVSAARGEIRPEGMGRFGRSRAAVCRSK